MTHRPADIPPDVWSGTFYGQAERLERAWLRLYCAAVPRPYRRTWVYAVVGWGPVGAAIFLVMGAGLRALDRYLER